MNVLCVERVRKLYITFYASVRSTPLFPTRLRLLQDLGCPMCGVGEETLHYFSYECEKYPPFPTRLRLLQLPWWFSCNRTDGDRTQLSALIGHRWAIRERFVIDSASGTNR